MSNIFPNENQIHCVTCFQDLVSTPFHGVTNAICWNRSLTDDFAEIVSKVAITENITILEEEDLCALELSEQGQLARDILLQDFNLLQAHGDRNTI